MATQDIMTKTTGNAPVPRSTSQAERRGSRRCKINQLMRIRPSDPEKDHFEDLRGSTSVSRSGVAFQTSEVSYEIGMRLFVTMPYSRDPSAINREYLAEVVRLEALPNGLNSVGIKLLMEMGMQHSYSFNPPPSRK
jgi:hypothetical protein